MTENQSNKHFTIISIFIALWYIVFGVIQEQTQINEISLFILIPCLIYFLFLGLICEIFQDHHNTIAAIFIELWLIFWIILANTTKQWEYQLPVIVPFGWMVFTGISVLPYSYWKEYKTKKETVVTPQIEVP